MWPLPRHLKHLMLESFPLGFEVEGLEFGLLGVLRILRVFTLILFKIFRPRPKIFTFFIVFPLGRRIIGIIIIFPSRRFPLSFQLLLYPNSLVYKLLKVKIIMEFNNIPNVMI